MGFNVSGCLPWVFNLFCDGQPILNSESERLPWNLPVTNWQVLNPSLTLRQVKWPTGRRWRIMLNPSTSARDVTWISLTFSAVKWQEECRLSISHQREGHGAPQQGQTETNINLALSKQQLFGTIGRDQPHKATPSGSGCSCKHSNINTWFSLFLALHFIGSQGLLEHCTELCRFWCASSLEQSR